MNQEQQANGPLQAFIERWGGKEGGQERANYAPFLSELCDVIGVDRPDPAGATHEHNDYVFERSVTLMEADGPFNGRIDLYKRNAFILEAKQSRSKPEKALPGTFKPARASGAVLGKRGAERNWDATMRHAKAQAERYARALPVEHGWPPFIMTCDVGHFIEVYADFSGQGKNYTQFPDRNSYRIYLDDLRNDEVRERLRAIWHEPKTLDPATKTAKVTRDIANSLAQVSRSLENQFEPEAVASFLMRCLFTMFAEDTGLLPKDSFSAVLRECEDNPDSFAPMVSQLWEAMNSGDWALALKTKVRKFNGKFFKDRSALPIGNAVITELRKAAEYDWREVDPSIFGTLLEQALDPKERRSLGAHYTPRAYVERLVLATVIEPLREEWMHVQIAAEHLHAYEDDKRAISEVKTFHEKLCATRVLDPACGTGNFLYVALEMMKRLEGEVLETLADLGGQDVLNLSSHTVDPHQFLGIEVNPRAAAIAEVVLWIGYLQWHFRTKGSPPNDPVLKAFNNIEVRNAVLAWDGAPLPKIVGGKETYPNPRRPEWPAAEFIVGNPPFIGGKDVRARLGDELAKALWTANKPINESADFVMYWWDRAAELLTRKGTLLQRFGFVTTNSISQVFRRKVIERHLDAKSPISIVMAIADHPWTKATRDAAAVRIAMTVCEAGAREGVLRDVVREDGLETDTPLIEFTDRHGAINADLTTGVDVTKATNLTAMEGISSAGVKLHGAGFIISKEVAVALGLNRKPGLLTHIRPYRNGRDLTARARNVMAIDFFGLTAEDVRKKFPEAYQHLLHHVKPERDGNRDKDIRERWWLFGRTRDEIRPALADIPRYIATVETTKHRVFQFLDASILPDNMLVAIGSDDAFNLGTLSSRIHATWALRAGGWLGVGNDPRYSKSRCFDPFPFPDANNIQKHIIREIAEELDGLRKRVLAEHEHLTLTGLYNVLKKLRAGTKPNEFDAKDRRIFDDGLVLVLKELHDKLDKAVSDAYGWPHDLADDEILARLVTLNRERAEEEKRGLIRWLRPDYQQPRFGKTLDKQAAAEAGAQVAAEFAGMDTKQLLTFPKSDKDQIAAVLVVLASIGGMADAAAIARHFKRSRTAPAKIEQLLRSAYRAGYIFTRDGVSFGIRRVA